NNIEENDTKREQYYQEYMGGMIQSGAYKGHANDAVRAAYYEGDPPHSFDEEVAEIKRSYASDHHSSGSGRSSGGKA
ncbi:MAG: hypothetical protein LBH28_01205, partial [Oscillospiraceae bacterium]|nr:hypothetical protein [Oscillospiraceae bacterium]